MSGRQRTWRGWCPATSRVPRAGEPRKPQEQQHGPCCPGASARLRNTLSPSSHKSGFYVAMNRAEQWLCFRPWTNGPSLSLPAAIRSLNMVGPGILAARKPHEDRLLLGCGGGQSPSPGGLWPAWTPPDHRRKCCWPPQLPVGLAGGQCPIAGGREVALGIGWRLPTSSRTGPPPLLPPHSGQPLLKLSTPAEVSPPCRRLRSYVLLYKLKLE